MPVKDDLIATKALIDTPEKWGKGGREVSGCLCISEAIHDLHPGAVRFTGQDVMIALQAALPSSFEEDWDEWNHPVVQFNDHPSTTHADVMALFDRAIAAA